MTITSFNPTTRPKAIYSQPRQTIASPYQANLMAKPDSLLLRFGSVETQEPIRVRSQREFKYQVNLLSMNGTNQIPLTAAKPPQGEQWEILKGLYPGNEWDDRPFMQEERAFEKGNKLNFYETGKIPELYNRLTTADVKLCHDMAEFLHKELDEKKPITQVVDLGSGGDEFKKASIFLEQLHSKKRQKPIVYIPTDLDDGMLQTASDAFIAKNKMPDIKIATLEGDFEDTIPLLYRTNSPDRRLYLFLGFTIGNMPSSHLKAFANYVNKSAAPGSLLAVSYANAPRIEPEEKALKDIRNRIKIYADPVIRDMLTYNFDVVNDILVKNGGQGFDKNKWEYLVEYNDSRVERKFRCKAGQSDTIRFPDQRTRTFKAGEIINLGFTRQFTPQQIEDVFGDFECIHNQIDESNFVGMMLLRKKTTPQIVRQRIASVPRAIINSLPGKQATTASGIPIQRTTSSIL